MGNIRNRSLGRMEARPARTNMKAIPGSPADRFCGSKYLRVMGAALVMMALLQLYSLVQSFSGGENSTIILFTLVECGLLVYAAVRTVQCSSARNEKSVRSSGTAMLIWGIVEIMMALVLTMTYISMNSYTNEEEFMSGSQLTDEYVQSVRDGSAYTEEFMTEALSRAGYDEAQIARVLSGDMEETEYRRAMAALTKAQWDATFILQMLVLLPTLASGAAAVLLFAAFRRVAGQFRARVMEGKILTAASLVCTMTSGLMLCKGIMNAMMTGNIAGGVISFVAVLPEAAFFYAAAVLLRTTVLEGKEA